MIEYYNLFVNYGPIVTIIGFMGFYGIMIYDVLRGKVGRKETRYSFLLLLIALIPNFMAHLLLALVHGAWTPFIAEVVNIVPVVIYLILNEYYIKKNNSDVNIGYILLPDEVPEKVSKKLKKGK